MKATLVAREEMVRNWQSGEAPPAEPVAGPPLRALNLKNVLDLGNTVFFIFRGRAYGIPPLAWREGEKLLDAWQEATAHGALLTREKAPAYFRSIKKLSRLLWANTVPTGPFRRLLRFLHIHPNPFRLATEGEIAELAVFLLGRRMTKYDPPPLPMVPPSPGTS